MDNSRSLRGGFLDYIMIDHELRKRVVAEMHLRRWPVLSLPSLVMQWVLLVTDREREAETEIISKLPDAGDGATQPAHQSGRLSSGVAYAWERNSEGSSIALFIEGMHGNPLGCSELPDNVRAAIAWAESLPGAIMRATQIFVVSDDASAEKLLPDLDFKHSDLVSCHFGGSARMWCDFRLKDDNFGKLLVAANGIDVRDLTRLLQRLQDLGNYRNKALMGLPVAQEAWPRLDAAEQKLSDLAYRVAGQVDRDDTLMDELSGLSLELTAIAAGIDYRMSATAAYAQLVHDRLEQLDVRRIEGFASLTNFTQRRFLPAVRTCAAVVERERKLSLRASQLASLLRARIETRIENQNASLLRSMDESSRLQLRLQQLVEGLSVVALSYYLIGLLGYVLKGAGPWLEGLDPELVLGSLVIPVMFTVFTVMKFLKSQLMSDAD